MEHFDVVVVGAGISGIGAAYHLQTMSPSRRFVVLEARKDIGGTWDLFRYPGVRSDSDMYTLGYKFKTWTAAKSIADGASIKEYLRETVCEFGIGKHIRFGKRMTAASWSSQRGVWTVSIADQEGGTSHMTCNFLFMCAGYYSYRSGYRAEIPGIEDFRGTVVHPQFWPEELDYVGKRVVVIGSGATAMSIVPAMARDAAHVTMIQRSPTYVVSRPDVDRTALWLRMLLPAKVAYRVIRWKNAAVQQFFYRRIRSYPKQARQRLIDMVRARVGDAIDVDLHFAPSYNPWDQRLCLLPKGDLLDALKDGSASIVTDTIAGFDAHRVRVSSGEWIETDIVVTATGLQLVVLGEAQFDIDGKAIDFANTFTYKGLGFSGIPNLFTSFGYINASWTLKSDLTCEYVCRLLNHMTETRTQVCTPMLRAGEELMQRRPWIDGFTPGYMLRDMHRFPSQGDREPWLNPQNFKKDIKLYRHSAVDDGVMMFSKAMGSNH